MVEVKRGRGRPRKNIEVKRPVGRPKGSKNKSKPTTNLTVEQRLEIVEMGMLVLIEAIGILAQTYTKKKTR